jgi:hypothetical protein
MKRSIEDRMLSGIRRAEDHILQATPVDWGACATLVEIHHLTLWILVGHVYNYDRVAIYTEWKWTDKWEPVRHSIVSIDEFKDIAYRTQHVSGRFPWRRE